MTVLRFEIRHPNGHRETAVVEGERALIGSASYADVRLPVDQAAYEHVVIEVIAGKLRAVARAYQPPATINGMPLTSSSIDPNTVLGVGTVQIFVALLVEGAQQLGEAPKKAKKKDSSSALVRVVLVIALAAGAYLMLGDSETGPPRPPANVPALFSSAPATCSQGAAAQALELARDTARLAEGKRERHPFAPSEGVAAVELYRQSAACYRVAQENALATEADAAAQQLKDTIATDFRARRLRLEHMLKVGDYELAERDVLVLAQLTQGKPGPYTSWLSSLATDLKRRRGPVAQ